MKMRLLPILRTLSVCALLVLSSALAVSTLAAHGQDKPKEQPKVSEEEGKALQKINSVPSTAEKLKLAVEFNKKFKKSSLRGKLADYLVTQISNEKDPTQKLQLAQQFSATFDQPDEIDLIRPTMIDAYATTGKYDEAYTEGEKYLAKHPDDAFISAQLGWAGAFQVQKQGPTWKHAQTAAQHLAKALEMLEGDKKPERTDAKYWTEYRNSWLPRLYQAQGLLAYLANDKAKAKDSLEKSAGLDPYDLSTLAMLGNIANDEYNELAKRYQTERKSDLLNKALEKMDEVIDWYARGVAAAEGNPQMQAMRQQMLEQLKQYYEFRHDGKSDGLQELINKYKKPAK
jgi:hypothetical protein